MHPQDICLELFKKYSGKLPVKTENLAASGSGRVYFRFITEEGSIIAAYNQDRKENQSFFYFTDFFLRHSLNVPQIVAVNDEETAYLLEDLGRLSLFDYIQAHRNDSDYEDKLMSYFCQAATDLSRFQIEHADKIDYSFSHPHKQMDKQAVLWDLNYFKYCFLKPFDVSFDDLALEKDFHGFADYLMNAGGSYFQYRDFQSRNIMIKDEELYYIDYQGGREGFLQYDLVSLLFQARAGLSPEFREEVCSYYLGQAKRMLPHLDENAFIAYYHAFAFLRVMQVLGAYGFRGLYQNKAHFIKSIPPAVENLKFLLESSGAIKGFPSLEGVCREIIEKQAKNNRPLNTETLNIDITSFSYMKGLPKDTSGHGGGFVFDCRFLPNPGREEAYKTLTGMDDEVIEYFKLRPEVDDFIEQLKEIVMPAIDNYQKRSFNYLSISFGCTGGQHRSVYCASRLFDFLNKIEGINVILSHREIDGFS